jgi:hypothetical protein
MIRGFFRGGTGAFPRRKRLRGPAGEGAAFPGPKIFLILFQGIEIVGLVCYFAITKTQKG